MMRFLVILAVFSSLVHAEAGSIFETTIPRRVQIATGVWNARMASSDRIPFYILDHSQCVASMRVAKAGFFWGGEGSTGLVSCRTAQGWSVPSFFNVGGVSFGIQFGVQFLDSILVFMTDYSRQVLYRPTAKIGLDLSYAVGPVGEGTSTGYIPQAHVLSYDRAVGLYVGASIQGLVITHAPERNAFVYGQGITPTQLLSTPGKYSPPMTRPFVDAVSYYSH